MERATDLPAMINPVALDEQFELIPGTISVEYDIMAGYHLCELVDQASGWY